ncbi:uncharacterized protein L969DRAFT_94904 [Mixia osmundae IAM 14324]|uniref:uncharacterized protein n=1 Tax=Mixia osmundae (strain CBS 9802 / IAM 14324 / JCM 22182 / KY 12970) TaxID=764103 RepID=UPI0004A54B7C|nr:uncharacterized protein L969DRAFT_94904 [Mixia osmundae IAM 14324]KEI38710.1 hypothetical protein L969DRAFT_94904 [Mixia osmundae IAM 14324]
MVYKSGSRKTARLEAWLKLMLRTTGIMSKHTSSDSRWSAEIVEQNFRGAVTTSERTERGVVLDVKAELDLSGKNDKVAKAWARCCVPVLRTKIFLDGILDNATELGLPDFSLECDADRPACRLDSIGRPPPKTQCDLEHTLDTRTPAGPSYRYLLEVAQCPKVINPSDRMPVNLISPEEGRVVSAYIRMEPPITLYDGWHATQPVTGATVMLVEPSGISNLQGASLILEFPVDVYLSAEMNAIWNNCCRAYIEARIFLTYTGDVTVHSFTIRLDCGILAAPPRECTANDLRRIGKPMEHSYCQGDLQVTATPKPFPSNTL